VRTAAFNWSRKAKIERSIALAALVLAALGPFIFNDYWANQILVETFLFGIAAASLIFLSAYGGMVSLAQTALFGIAGVIIGNLVTKGGAGGTSKGLHLGWDPTLALVVAIAMTTAIGLIFGAVAARSTGIYFLMITLTYSVITTYFLGQVTIISGFSGIGGINNYTPPWVGDVVADPIRLYYVSLITAVLSYALIRYVVRTPFGISLQGVRDEPIRMSSLGYNVPLHRTLAFGFAAFLASLSGILYVWWSGQIAPGNVDLPETINLLVIAVIGGLTRIEGAWVGALTFIIIQNYVRDFNFPGLGFGGTLFGGSFNTVIGIIFLVIVLVSPSGLMGIWDRALSTRLRVGRASRAAEAPTAGTGG
jgi:branched-chain amino acid transport system permease protein